MRASFFCRVAFSKQTIFSLVFACSIVVSSAQKTAPYGSTKQKDTLISGFKPTAGSDRYYRIYVGVAYSLIKHHGGKLPYAASHTIGLNYSITENSFHPYYESHFPEAFGPWEFSYKLGYDGIRRTNYYGMGNETKRTTTDKHFNWLRTHHQYANVGVNRTFARYHRFSWDIVYDGIQVLDDKDRYIAKSRNTIDPAEFNWQYFMGSRLSYTYTHLDNPDIPTKGLSVNSAISYQQNLHRSGHSFARYSTDWEAYIPFSSTISYAFRAGLASLTGNPDFYQYNTVGGTNTLRGYERWRFYGRTAFYNQNEIRWIKALEKGGASGHLGFFALYDIGRVWLPDENSSKMHYGYGIGIILAPLDKLVASGAFAISNEDRTFHVTVGKTF